MMRVTQAATAVQTRNLEDYYFTPAELQGSGELKNRKAYDKHMCRPEKASRFE
jgi:hypothetical protein